MPSIRVESVGPEALETCFRIRRAVFVAGQGVDEAIEIDGLDARCRHFLAWQGEEPIGTARLREVAGAAKAERVAVLDAHRGSGAGRALMRALERLAAEQGKTELVLNAQEAVIPFYEKLGYVAEGETFEEAGIPHRAMRKRVAASGWRR